MERKNRIILLGIIFMLIVVFSGVTYAYFTSLTSSESASTIYARGGTMNVTFQNLSGNISMENIYPREAAWVNKRFVITGNNTTELDMGYRVYLVTQNSDFKFGDLTYSLSGTSTYDNDTLISKENQVVSVTSGEQLLGSGIFRNRTSYHTYELKIFYKDNGKDQNDGQNRKFLGYVIIDSASGLEYDSLISYKSEPNFNTSVFNGPVTHDSVEAISFNTNIDVPSNAIYSWDASENQNGSVVAYVLDEDNNGKYELYIGQNDKVVLGPNAKNLFSYLQKVRALDFSNVDTSRVTNMSNMFLYDNFDSLNISNFNTNRVNNMSYMFGNVSVKDLDLSSFDTSNVTSMSGMFNSMNASSLKGLENLNTSNVTNMSYMFYRNMLTTLNLSNFDTSNVTNMSYMFSENKTTSLDLSSFNTSNVTSMSNMFSYSILNEFDLSSFDLSNVKDSYNMFYNCKATVGYARTQVDADKLNSIYGKPSSLTFTVKS